MQGSGIVGIMVVRPYFGLGFGLGLRITFLKRVCKGCWFRGGGGGGGGEGMEGMVKGLGG